MPMPVQDAVVQNGNPVSGITGGRFSVPNSSFPSFRVSYWLFRVGDSLLPIHLVL